MTDTPVSDGWEQAKKWYKSKTIIGVIIALAGGMINAIFPEAGINVFEKVDLILETGEAIAPKADIAYGQIVAILGLIQAFYGRLVANKKVVL